MSRLALETPISVLLCCGRPATQCTCVLSVTHHSGTGVTLIKQCIWLGEQCVCVCVSTLVVCLCVCIRCVCVYKCVRPETDWSGRRGQPPGRIPPRKPHCCGYADGRNMSDEARATVMAPSQLLPNAIPDVP